MLKMQDCITTSRPTAHWLREKAKGAPRYKVQTLDYEAKQTVKQNGFFPKTKIWQTSCRANAFVHQALYFIFYGLVPAKNTICRYSSRPACKKQIGVLVHFRLSPLWSSDKMASKKPSKRTSSCSSWIFFRGGAGTGCLKQASTTLQAESQSHFHGKLTKPMKRCLSFPTWPRWTNQFSVLHEKKWQTLRRRRKSRNEAACRMVAGRRARLHRITDHEKQLGSSMVTLVNNAYEQSH